MGQSVPQAMANSNWNDSLSGWLELLPHFAPYLIAIFFAALLGGVALAVGGSDVIVGSWWPEFGELAGRCVCFGVCVYAYICVGDRLLHMSRQLNSNHWGVAKNKQTRSTPGGPQKVGNIPFDFIAPTSKYFCPESDRRGYDLKL